LQIYFSIKAKKWGKRSSLLVRSWKHSEEEAL
jgi:hypothetical protein